MRGGRNVINEDVLKEACHMAEKDEEHDVWIHCFDGSLFRVTRLSLWPEKKDMKTTTLLFEGDQMGLNESVVIAKNLKGYIVVSHIAAVTYRSKS